MADKSNAQRIRDLINKAAGEKVSFNLNENNPTVVEDWIGTGSRWLDSIICNGKLAGIPCGKITELAGIESSGKSYMALQIAINALKKDMEVVYFDSESAIDVEFIGKMGMNVDDFIYVQATTVEFVCETIEQLLADTKRPILFIWDSLAMTPTKLDLVNDFNPLASMAEKARVLAKAFPKLIMPLANKKSAFLVLNQLKTNITANPYERMTDPFTTPGGKSPAYAYSLRLWLYGSKAKDSMVRDEAKNIIGTQCKVKVKKSRFGSFGREAEFKLLWAGDKIAIQDEESWLDAIAGSPELTGGAWKAITLKDGTEAKFQEASFTKKLLEPAFRERILEIMEHWLVDRYADGSTTVIEQKVETNE
jgi:recombination protein RecA